MDKVYKYGLLKPTINEDLVRNQIWLAHRYYNKLVEIERSRRDDIVALYNSDETIKNIIVTISYLEKENEELHSQAAEYRKINRTKEIPKELSVMSKNNILELRKNRKIFFSKIKEATERFKLEINKINEKYKQKNKEARANCGVYWGTYLLVENACDASFKKVLLFDKYLRTNYPIFKKWTGEGNIAVQIQTLKNETPLFIKDVFDNYNNNNGLVQIRPVNEKAWYSDKRSERRFLSKTELVIKVVSDSKRKPIYAHFPMIMHREIPSNAKITWAVVSLIKKGPEEIWSVQFNVSIQDLNIKPVNDKKIAIDIGWRKVDGGLRVATYGDNEKQDSLILPLEIISGFIRVDTLRSTRDDNFNEAISKLYDWIKINNNLPEWFIEKTKYISKWKSITKLVSLVKFWKNNRFENDDIYDKLEAWRYHDEHLWRWETNQRKKTLNRRREFYRCFAAKLAKEYGKIVLEDFNMAKICKNKDIYNDQDENETAHSNRFLAAVSELRLCIKNAFKHNGGKVGLVNPSNTSKKCSYCGYVNNINEQVMQKCENCKKEYDRDCNAVCNIYNETKIEIEVEKEKRPRKRKKEKNITIEAVVLDASDPVVSKLPYPLATTETQAESGG